MDLKKEKAQEGLLTGTEFAIKVEARAKSDILEALRMKNMQIPFNNN